MSCIDSSSFVSCTKRTLRKIIKTYKFIYNNEKKKKISSQRQSNLQDEAQLSVPYKVSSLLLPRKKKLVFFLFTTLTLRKVRTVPEPEKKSRRDAKMRWDVIYNASY